MIDQLKFMDDLKEIKQMVEDQKPRYLIVDKCNEKIAEQQQLVNEFDKWADEESKRHSESENMAVSYDIGQDGGVEDFG